MSEPLDFSTVGKAKTGPAPPPSATRLPAGPGWFSFSGRRPLLVAAVAASAAVAAYLLFGRGDDHVDGRALTSYCSLATEFDQLPVEGADAATIGQFLQSLGGSVDEMKQVAPKTIRADVAASVDAVREAAAGKPEGLQSADQQARRQRIIAFRQQACGGADQGNA